MSYKSIIVIISSLLIVSCGEYERLLKSTDHQLKREKAVEYFEEGRYTRATELLAQILPRYRGSAEAEELNWLNARAHYELRDYMMAGSLFNRFNQEFSWSRYAEEALFLAAYCSYMISPRPDLDQGFTREAIEGFEQFKRRYPYSNRVEEANSLIVELQEKLVEKSYLSARLYYDLKNYKAAAVAFASALNQYPDTKYREEMMFLKLNSQFLYAQNSVEERQLERYQTAYDEYLTFVEEFPQSDFSREVEQIHSSLMEVIRPVDIDGTE
jgi:outer membrane protein assembly factor BamD